MARTTKISKEIILGTALKMLIRDGYKAINIKTLSKEIGCSTQPLVWHFHNMGGFRKAFADFTLAYANRKMCPSSESAIDAFEEVGHAYVKIALDEPNVFQFVFLNGSGCYPTGNMDMLIKEKDHKELIQRLAKAYQISEQSAGQYLQNTVIYTHGLAAFAATKMMNIPEEEIMAMIHRAGNHFLMEAGVPLEKIEKR